MILQNHGCHPNKETRQMLWGHDNCGNIQDHVVNLHWHRHWFKNWKSYFCCLKSPTPLECQSLLQLLHLKKGQGQGERGCSVYRLDCISSPSRGPLWVHASTSVMYSLLYCENTRVDDGRLSPKECWSCLQVDVNRCCRMVWASTEEQNKRIMATILKCASAFILPDQY